MSTMSITIEGQAFEQGIPASTLKALVDFQRVVYKAYAMKNGISVRSLSREERQKLEIIFDIRKGSVIINFIINDFVPSLLNVIGSDLEQYALEQIREHYHGLSETKSFEYVFKIGLGVMLNKITGCHKGKITKLKLGDKIFNGQQVKNIKKQFKKIFNRNNKGDKK